MLSQLENFRNLRPRGRILDNRLRSCYLYAMAWKTRQVVEHWHGVDCSNHCMGYARSHGGMNDWALKMLGARCVCGGTFVEYHEDVECTLTEYQQESTSDI